VVHHVLVATSVKEVLLGVVLVSAKDVLGLLANVRDVSVRRIAVSRSVLVIVSCYFCLLLRWLCLFVCYQTANCQCGGSCTCDDTCKGSAAGCCVCVSQGCDGSTCKCKKDKCFCDKPCCVKS